MDEITQNLFKYIDDLDNEQLINLQNQIIADIEYLKEIKDKKNLDFEIERLRYIRNIFKERNEIDIKKL